LAHSQLEGRPTSGRIINRLPPVDYPHSQPLFFFFCFSFFSSSVCFARAADSLSTTVCRRARSRRAALPAPPNDARPIISPIGPSSTLSSHARPRQLPALDSCPAGRAARRATETGARSTPLAPETLLTVCGLGCLPLARQPLCYPSPSLATTMAANCTLGAIESSLTAATASACLQSIGSGRQFAAQLSPAAHCPRANCRRASSIRVERRAKSGAIGASSGSWRRLEAALLAGWKASELGAGSTCLH